MEVLVVIAIMSILSAVVAFAVIPMYVESQKKAARLSASSLRRVAGTWRLNHTEEECPKYERLLADKLVDGEGNANDPWGTPYLIACSADDVIVVSLGPDRKLGTSDDIVVPKGASVSATVEP